MPAHSSAERPSKGRILRSVAGRSRKARTKATSATGTFIKNSQGQSAMEKIADTAVGPTEIATPTINA